MSHNLARLTLSVGGLGIVLTAEDPGLRFAVSASTSRFVGGAGDGSLVFRVRKADLGGARPGCLVFKAGEWWTLRQDTGDWIYDNFSRLNGSVPFVSARLHADLSGGEITLHAPYFRDVEEVDPLPYPLAELLFNRVLARTGGVELHACGIVDEEGHGLVFAGRSGDGKTTTARLWSERPAVTILSDDRVVLTRQGDGFVIHGTPWHGEAAFAANASVPLSALFLLEHGAATETVPISGADVVANLMPRCFPPLHDRQAVERVLDTFLAVATGVPCFRFPFVPGPAAVEAARRAVEGLRR